MFRMMSGIVLFCFLCLLRPALAEVGIVSFRVSGCDYYLIAAPSGLVLAEWYGGYDPSRDDKVIGSFNTYGFVTLFVGSNASETNAYIEDYMLDNEDALEKLSEQCR